MQLLDGEYVAALPDAIMGERSLVLGLGLAGGCMRRAEARDLLPACETSSAWRGTGLKDDGAPLVLGAVVLEGGVDLAVRVHGLQRRVVVLLQERQLKRLRRRRPVLCAASDRRGSHTRTVAHQVLKELPARRGGGRQHGLQRALRPAAVLGQEVDNVRVLDGLDERVGGIPAQCDDQPHLVGAVLALEQHRAVECLRKHAADRPHIRAARVTAAVRRIGAPAVVARLKQHLGGAVPARLHVLGQEAVRLCLRARQPQVQDLHLAVCAA